MFRKFLNNKLEHYLEVDYNVKKHFFNEYHQDLFSTTPCRIDSHNVMKVLALAQVMLNLNI